MRGGSVSRKNSDLILKKSENKENSRDNNVKKGKSEDVHYNSVSLKAVQ